MIQGETKAQQMQSLCETLPKCECGGDVVQFYCDQESCPDHAQLLYCQDCVEERDKHNHKGRTIVKESLSHKQKWVDLRTNTATVLGKIEPFFMKRKELIDYLIVDDGSAAVKTTVTRLRDDVVDLQALLP